MGKIAGSWRWDFFIAHAGTEKATAERLYDLMTGDPRVFLDSRCLEYGDLSRLVRQRM
jgi:hypothetical protein